MIKAEVVQEKDGAKLYVEAQSETDVADLDEIYRVIMSKGKKVGGYNNSLKFEILLLNE
jgi:hypothetical protein